MIGGEVKGGQLTSNPVTRDPVVLQVVLPRFGCCGSEKRENSFERYSLAVVSTHPPDMRSGWSCPASSRTRALSAARAHRAHERRHTTTTRSEDPIT